jgi:sortase A
VLARILSAVGRSLIGAGVLLLLFVAYQLWGTGLHEARAQEDLGSELAARLGAAAPAGDPGSTSTTAGPAPTAAPSTAPTTSGGLLPSTTTTVAPSSGAGAPAPVDVKPGEALARILIPRIGVDKVVVSGVSVDDLRKGPGHYRSTPQPGRPGNAAIAGHRTTYGAPFGDIDRLVPGDVITVQTLHGTFNYDVLPAPGDPTSGHFVVAPEDVWVLDDAGDNRLTLTACHPKFSAAQRIVVVARLREPPAPPPPSTTVPVTTPGRAGEGGGRVDGDDDGDLLASATATEDADLDQGLGGDPSARGPAILWGLVFVALLAAIWQLGLRWRRVPACALGAVPMVIVLFSWFEQLDRWMPAR